MAITRVAAVVAMVGGLGLAGTAQAASNHYILYNNNRNLGWCANGSGQVITVSSACAGETWVFSAKTTFDGYTAYQITRNGQCATVATSNGGTYIQGDLVLVGCVSGASNQLFVDPTNPGWVYSDWGGYYYGCGALGSPLVYNSQYGYYPPQDVTAAVCTNGTSWYLPLT